MLKALEILKKNGLRVTEPRLSVLEAILAKGSAITQKELNEHPKFTGHRVTLYRALKQMEEAGVLEKIADRDGEIHYAIKHVHGEVEKHLHPHFNCKKCSRVICLNEIDLPKLLLPKGYEKEHISLMVYGVCENCAK